MIHVERHPKREYPTFPGTVWGSSALAPDAVAA